MFQIVRDPPSGNNELCLTEITRGCSQIFFVCVHGTTGWELVPSPSYHAHTPQVQNYASKHRPSTRKISVSHHE